MKKINVADITLSSAAKQQAGRFGFKEKLEIAKSLDKLGVDVIEFAEIENAKTDTLLVKTVLGFVKSSKVSLNVGMTEESVECAAAAISGASNARLSVSLPVSPTQMEYNCFMKADKILALAKMLVTKCKESVTDVEFVAVDATRAEPEFLKSIITSVIECGATLVTVCDNEGSMLPAETEVFVRDVIATASGTPVGYQCDNTYGMALSSAVTATFCGATEIKVAINSRAYTRLEKYAEIMRNRGDSLECCTSLNMPEMSRTAAQVAWIASEKRGEINPTTENNKEVVLTKGDDITAVNKMVRKLGYDLSKEDKAKVYDAFMRVAEKKNGVTLKELDAVIATVALEVPPTYIVKDYVINSGNHIAASASIGLEKGGELCQGISIGDGPIDAAFIAIEQIVGRHFELDDFQVQSVGEGREAVGSTVVKLRSGGKLYSGQGISTDIIGASIRAYVNAVNKIIYDEENK